MYMREQRHIAQGTRTGLNFLKTESGSALLASTMLIVLLTGAGLAAMTTTSLNQNKTKNLRTEKQAFYLAEAGLAHGKIVLNQNLANWNTYATYTTPTTLIPATSLSGLGSYKVTIQAASGPGLLMTATGTSNDNTSTSTSSLMIIGFANLASAIITGQDLTISGSPTIDGTSGSVFANRNLTISGSPHITMNAEAVGTYTVQSPGAPVVGGFAGGRQPASSINNITASTFSTSYDYLLKSNGDVYNSSGTRLFNSTRSTTTWNCWTATPAVAATAATGKRPAVPATPATWTLTCSTPPNGTFYVQGNAVIGASAGTSLAKPWIATILADLDIHVTTNATALYMRPPVLGDTYNGSNLYNSATQNLLFIATGDLWIEGTGTQSFSNGIASAHEQVSISGNPTFSGYIVAQDAASASSTVTSNSISGNMHLTFNGNTLNSNISNPQQGSVQTQSTLY